MSNGIPQKAMQTLQQVSSGMIIDALAMIGVQGGVRGVRPARGFEDAKVIGPAATVKFGEPSPEVGKFTMYRCILNSSAGSVLVIDGRGIDGHFTGDNQGEWAMRHGLVGTVVYGGARDIAGYREMGMPVYCTGSATADKPKGLQIVGHNVPVALGDVTVQPGDVVFCDEDGVVVIPSEKLDAMLEKMEIILKVEEGMSNAIKAGAPVEELERVIAMKKPGK